MGMAVALLFYALALVLLSRMTAPKQDNTAFFRAGRRSPWMMVAYGMIGASVSGVSVVSVPGMVMTQQMTYLQMCLGFILGYLVIAFVLLPLYYRLNLTTIYAYLELRLGRRSRLTGASFFLLSKMTGAAVKFYVVCFLLHELILEQWGCPFALTAVMLITFIYLYTQRGGIKTLVWTDVLQTTCMLLAIIVIFVQVMHALHLSWEQLIPCIEQSGMSRIFITDDVSSPHYFWKQLLSGMFVVIVMTGLDQDMMQKNLTCKNLRAAQKDMCVYGLAFVPFNLLLLTLGLLLVMLAQQQGLPLPGKGDELLPMFAATGRLGYMVVVLFTLGVVAASFSSADSALTALTTSCCVDIYRRENDVTLRRRVHLLCCLFFLGFILLFRAVDTSSVIDAVYVLCGYTYGPLLGLFAFSLFTPWGVIDRYVPAVAIVSPILSFGIDKVAILFADYHMGYELLILNGTLTFFGLLLLKK